MRRDVTSAGVLAKDGGTKVPAVVAVAGEIVAAEPAPKQRSGEHGLIVGDTARQTRCNGEVHSRVSGGR
jgi:hypothetical protein